MVSKAADKSSKTSIAPLPIPITSTNVRKNCGRLNDKTININCCCSPFSPCSFQYGSLASR